METGRRTLESWVRAVGWCFSSAIMAPPNDVIDCTMSFSSATNSAASFSRIPVACSNASVLDATSSPSLATSDVSCADFALYSFRHCSELVLYKPV